jgi:hypothetical protein
MSRRFASFLTIAALAVGALIMAASPVLAQRGGRGSGGVVRGGFNGGGFRNGFNGGGFRNDFRGGFNGGGFRNDFRGGGFFPGTFVYGIGVGSYGYGPPYPFGFGNPFLNGASRRFEIR